MIALIFTLALAMRSVAQGFRTLAAVEIAAAAGRRRKTVRARPSPFPAVSLLDPLAGKRLSLLTRAGDLAQHLDFLRDPWSRRADFGAENENLPCFRVLAGKFESRRGPRQRPGTPSRCYHWRPSNFPAPAGCGVTVEPVALIRGRPILMFALA
jgi:hypothetical protein